MAGITPEQTEKIKIYLNDVTWPHIKKEILNESGKTTEEEAEAILFDMETIYKQEAAGFGLSAMS